MEASHQTDIWEVEVYLHMFLMPVLDGARWMASCPGCFILHENTPILNGKDARWAEIRLDVVAKRNILSCWESNPSYPLSSLVHYTN